VSHNTRGVSLGIPEVVFTPQDAERFWSKVERQGPIPAHRFDLGRCWQWTASLIASRYGQFRMQANGACGKQVTVYAHRLSYILSHGPIPDDLQVLHECDNTRCVNPAHLKLGTHKSNMEDAADRGRLHVPRPGRQRVTDGQLAEMLALVSAGMPQSHVAKQFGVSKAYVTRLRQGSLRQYSLPPVAAEKAS